MKTKKNRTKKKYQEFKVKHLSSFADILPFFVLKGTKDPIKDYDTYAILESFLSDDSDLAHNELWDLMYYLSDNNEDQSEKIMQMLYGGWYVFDSYEPYYQMLDSKEFLLVKKKNRLATIHALKCMIAGMNHADWYEETYQTFKELLPDYDLELFVSTFAATSPMAHLRSNLMFALQAYDCIKKGKSIETLRLIPPAKAMLRDLQAGLFNGVPRDSSRRKVLNFKNAILGDTSAVIVDSWMLKAYDIGREYEWNGKMYCRPPFKGVYDCIEQHIQTLGEATGYEARQITAMIWSGIRILHSKFKDADTKRILSEILSTQ